ncbi:MAG: protein kinase [Pyrinomonadaceae bacterium]
MTPQQYERLTELFHAALEIAPDERAAYLDQVSDGDVELRRELESLLAAHEQRAAYTEKPPDDIAAGMYLAQDNDAEGAPSLAPNTRLDRYEIRSLVAKGGMGEVYLAEDLRLHRKVALKILPAAVAANQDRMRRFQQEAQAAAALNHPNIAHMYEIGAADGVNFIAMEFVDGVTLRAKIHSEHTELRKLLKYLQQVAEGLAKAHAAGIVHRDLKPDNIMITRDDYAKILDFGLAKLVETQRSFGLGVALASEAGTAIMAQQSIPGMVMGTAGYMSPEQAQGKVKEIDQRSDIFSFGCILFEAVTGQRPFADESLIKSLHKAIYEDAPPIKDFNPSAPPDLERVIRRCLAKDREERYQTIKDVALELKEVRQGMAAFLASFSHFKHNRVAALSERDTILIADFDNKTGDAIFDGTLKQGLAVQLEQSPFLNLFGDTRVRDTLKLMNRSPEGRLTVEIGQEICQRQGLKATIAGSIAPLGSHYVLTLMAINSNSGEVVAREQVEAESKEHVLKALGKAASGLREKLGESLSSIERFDAPLELTTSSLEALKVLSLGLELRLKGRNPEVIPFYKRAIELDPNFAYAYIELAAIYDNTTQPRQAAEYVNKAFELRDRVSELERLRITYFFYTMATGEFDRAIGTLELYKQTYPRDERAYTYLSDIYCRIGRFEKGVVAASEALNLNSANAVNYVNLGELLLRLNRYVEARQVFEQASEQNLDNLWFHSYLYQIAFIEDGTAAMASQLAWFSGQRDEYFALDLQTGTASFRGEWGKAQDFSRRAIDLATRSGAQEVAARYIVEQALRAAIFDQFTEAKSMATQSLALSRDQLSLTRDALALALCGETAQARSFGDELVQRYPKDALISGIWLPVIRAALELQLGNAPQAIESLEPAVRYETAAEFWPQYLRGQAYLKLGRGAEAAGEFQKILDHRGQSPLSVLYPLAHLGLARAAAMNGDATKARQSYQDFLALWKDADPDLPVLIEAKKEYEKLK